MSHCLTKIFLSPFRQPSFCAPILGASTRSHALSSQWKKWKPGGTMDCKRKIVLRQVETHLSHLPSSEREWPGCRYRRIHELSGDDDGRRGSPNGGGEGSDHVAGVSDVVAG